MRSRTVPLVVALLLGGVAAVWAFSSWRAKDAPPAPTPSASSASSDTGAREPVAGRLARIGEVVVATAECALPASSDTELSDVAITATDAVVPESAARIIVDYPFEGTLFPPDLVPPTFLWHDETDADAWIFDVRFADGERIRALVPHTPPSFGEVDPYAMGATNEVWLGTPYQQSAVAWTPSDAVWREVTQRTVETETEIRLVGIRSDAPQSPLSLGSVRIKTSQDPVGAPIFYRDVPLIPVRNEVGLIQPLDNSALGLINWRLRDVSRPESKVLLTGMPSCANCHSFSRDGSTMGMDVDGPQGDKGAYALTPVRKHLTIRPEDVITWNSFPDKPEGMKTIGFLSQVSPNGRYAITTLNEALYVRNFTDHKFLQVFYPTRGILGWTDRETGEMKALPGADDPAFVHTAGSWSPDGESIVFCRARARDPQAPGQELARYANDPNETQIRYELYRIPFRGGKGGEPEAVEGASANGMSNTFPKVSPDGRWIVFTRCSNGLLMRPDGRLWIVPFEGGEARELSCNLDSMNSWHTFSPNGRWLAFSSKSFTPYTQMFLTHIDDEGNDTPAVLIPNSTAGNRAVNIPEFVNTSYDEFDVIEVPAVDHHRFLSEGIQSLEAGRIDEAVSLFERALELAPDFSLAHTRLGEALTMLGRTDEAIRHCRAAVDANRLSPASWSRLGDALRQSGQLREAIRAVEEALRISETNPFSHNWMGLILADAKRTDDALRHYDRAIELYPTFVKAHLNAGYLLLQAGRTDEAEARYRTALETDGGNATAHRSLASILLRRGDTRGMVPHLETAIAGDPRDVQSRLALAWYLATSADDAVRNGARAVIVATEACELTDWKAPAPLDVLAAAQAAVGRFPQAAATMRKAIDLVRAGHGPAAAGLEDRLALYEAGRTYRADEGAR